ncbi:unnamed protein product [Moneuplotes crassus]|uniref:Uncharacterized protein n=1 Tax=Euplotes crassus TaxID=5936 RepID=A0AAD1U4F6_EUPCR|nr:unnamed protein product [Moneuplotes crassus]
MQNRYIRNMCEDEIYERLVESDSKDSYIETLRKRIKLLQHELHLSSSKNKQCLKDIKYWQDCSLTRLLDLETLKLQNVKSIKKRDSIIQSKSQTTDSNSPCSNCETLLSKQAEAQELLATTERSLSQTKEALTMSNERIEILSKEYDVLTKSYKQEQAEGSKLKDEFNQFMVESDKNLSKYVHDRELAESRCKSLSKEVSQLKVQKDATAKEILCFIEKLDTSSKEVKNLQNLLKLSEVKNSSLQTQLQQETDTKDAEIKKLNSKIDALEKSLKESEEAQKALEHKSKEYLRKTLKTSTEVNRLKANLSHSKNEAKKLREELSSYKTASEEGKQSLEASSTKEEASLTRDNKFSAANSDFGSPKSCKSFVSDGTKLSKHSRPFFLPNNLVKREQRLTGNLSEFEARSRRLSEVSSESIFDFPKLSSTGMTLPEKESYLKSYEISLLAKIDDLKQRELDLKEQEGSLSYFQDTVSVLKSSLAAASKENETLRRVFTEYVTTNDEEVAKLKSANERIQKREDETKDVNDKNLSMLKEQTQAILELQKDIELKEAINQELKDSAHDALNSQASLKERVEELEAEIRAFKDKKPKKGIELKEKNDNDKRIEEVKKAQFIKEQEE